MDGQVEVSISNSSNAENQARKTGLGGKEISEKDWAKKLISAVTSNSSDDVKSLLKYRDGKNKSGVGYDPNKIFGNDGLIDALFVAIEENSSSLATQLIKAKGARLGNKKPERQSRSPLHEAVRLNNHIIVKELLKHSECVRYIDLGDELGRSALHEAAARGYIEIVSELLSNKANVNVPDHCNMTPLHLTVCHGDSLNKMKVAEMLLDSFGAEVNTKDKAGDTPLHDACDNYDYNMAKLLLSHGADAGVRNSNGNTPPDLIPQEYDGANAVPQPYEVNAPFNELVELRQLFKRPWGISERKAMARVPGERPVCSKDNEKVCRDSSAYIRYYWRGQSWATSTSVMDLVYNETTLQEISNQFNTIIMQTRIPTTGEISFAEGEIWKWIHFSANNMTWVKDLVWLITHSKEHDFEERSRVWGFWDRTTNDREGAGAGRTRVPHVEDSWKEDRSSSLKAPANLAKNETSFKTDDEKIAKPSRKKAKTRDKKRMRSGWEKASNDERRDARLFPKKRSLSIVMPFIDFETEPYLKRTVVGERSERLKKMLDLFDRYSPYMGKDGLQIPKTLDESYYDMLSTERLTARDEDQVVYKWYKESNQRGDKLKELLEYFSWYRTLRALEDDSTVTGTGTEISPDDTVAEQPTNPNEPNIHGEPNPQPDSSEILQTEAPHAEPASEKDKVPPKDIPVKDYNNAETAKTTETTDNIAKLLMVHQLWLWKLGDNTVITCCPDRCHTGAEDTLIDTIRQGGIESMNDPDDLIERIVYECAMSLDKFCDAGLKAHVLDIFDNRIAKMSDEEVVHFKQFSKDMKDAKEGGKQSSSKGRSITDEINLLYEVKDVRDELNLVRRVFEAQAGVLEKFSRLFWPGFQEQSKRCRESFLEDCGIKGLIDRATRLDEDAKKTLEALDYLVQVKQAQTSLDEAEAARLLNNYIVLFTIVTIIFTPLSFITSLFSVPVKQFPHDGDNLSYEQTWFTGRIFAGELTTLAVILVIVIFQRKPWRNSKEPVGPPREDFKRPWHIRHIPEEYPLPWSRTRRRRPIIGDFV